ncbi:MAG: class I SAM-dependent rRNA methyltransferase [Proteobacteria bacterium]|nr:class I SAM-dependent rRNA methyltransferase [Pseudomonadota bacterium]
MFKRLHLRKNEEKRLIQGHLWIYSNEVDTQKSPLAQFSSGQLIEVVDARGNFLGTGYINPHTLLCGRLLTKNPHTEINLNFMAQRIQQALDLRQKFFSQPFYRLIYGESDLLPGLIVDRYGDLLVVQITTAGMEQLRELIIYALKDVISPKAILLRNDHGMRATEGLPEYVCSALGEPEKQYLIQENDAQFLVAPWTGQKTGWFYDHRENRRQLQRFVKGKKVLDVFSYLGAWSIQAAKCGAAEVWAVDSSAAALEQCQQNAELNQLKSTIHLCHNDAFDQLKKFIEAKKQFDVIVLDPPAFIKKRKDFSSGFLAYKRLNTLALQLLSNNGILISASCSHHLSLEDLQNVILAASISAKKPVRIIARGHQGLDHPVHPAIPETDYLKCIFCVSA